VKQGHAREGSSEAGPRERGIVGHRGFGVAGLRLRACRRAYRMNVKNDISFSLLGYYECDMHMCCESKMLFG